MAAAQEHEWKQDARASLPRCLQPGLVHLNNAGSSIPSQATLEAVQNYLIRSVREYQATGVGLAAVVAATAGTAARWLALPSSETPAGRSCVTPPPLQPL